MRQRPAQVRINIALLKAWTNALIATSAYDQAEMKCKMLLEMIPEDDQVLALCAVVDYYQGEQEAAANKIEKALAVNARSGAAYASKGLIEVEQGRYNEAESYFRHALSLGAEDANTHIMLGFALAKQGEEDAALAIYDEVGGRFNGNIAVLRIIAASLAKLGFTSKSEEYVKRADELDSVGLREGAPATAVRDGGNHARWTVAGPAGHTSEADIAEARAAAERAAQAAEYAAAAAQRAEAAAAAAQRHTEAGARMFQTPTVEEVRKSPGDSSEADVVEARAAAERAAQAAEQAAQAAQRAEAAAAAAQRQAEAGARMFQQGLRE